MNTHPEQKPGRWVINFFDWDLDKARQYPDCLNIVRELVYPERIKQKRASRKKYWWRYREVAPKLYSSIKALNRVLAIALTSRTGAFAFLPTDIVFSHAVGVFAFEDAAYLAILQSTFHIDWAWKYGSSLKQDLLYTVTNIFRTFPFPDDISALENIGEGYHETRKNIMLANDEGLTKTYNHFHHPDESAEEIIELRGLHVEMDTQVAEAYGWSDLDLGHDFHETQQGIRFTISESARREILTRLLKLNHERYHQEALEGLHGKKAQKEAMQSADQGQASMADKLIQAQKDEYRRKQERYEEEGDGAQQQSLFDDDDNPKQGKLFD